MIIFRKIESWNKRNETAELEMRICGKKVVDRIIHPKFSECI